MANTFTFASQTLTDANIFGGINFLHDLNTGEEFTIGNTASASVQFVTDTQLPLYSKDATNGTFTWTQDNVSRGRYYITEVTKASDKYEVTAYDAMILLDTSVTALSLTYPLSVSAAASAIATFIGCTTQGTINNGTMEAADGTIDDTVTCRQLLGWVAEASGCSVKIDGSDHICFMYYADSEITITASDYVEYGLNVADYTCAAIDNVTICDTAGMTAATAGSGDNSLFIQGNPFLYEATNTEAAVILGCVDSFVYAPFTCEMFDENGLEVGTIATFGTTATLVMHIESSENGATASAVGSDTRAEFNKDLDIIANEALAVANDAQQTAQATNLHFWYTATGSEAGAHIAEVSKPTFETNPSGGNVLIDSNSLDIRDGGDVIATFGADGVQIGKSDDVHMEMDEDSFIMKDNSGVEFAHIGSPANVRVTDTFIYSDDPTFTLSHTPSNIPVIKKNGTTLTSGIDYTLSGTTLTISATLEVADEITATYKTSSQIKYFSMGVRNGDAGSYSMAEGLGTTASGMESHAEGLTTTASGICAHAEGTLTTASGMNAHAEGSFTKASEDWSHAEGSGTTAKGIASHAEGSDTIASSLTSHAEGNSTTASGLASHAEGYHTKASSNYSHAGGYYTVADKTYQTAIGKYNTTGNTNNLFVVGNGTGTNARSDAFQVDVNGDVRAKGKYYFGSSNIQVRGILFTTVDSATTSVPSNTRVQITATYNVPSGYVVFVTGANVRATGTNYGQICLSGLQNSTTNGVCTLSCYARNTYSADASISLRFRLLLFTEL